MHSESLFSGQEKDSILALIHDVELNNRSFLLPDDSNISQTDTEAQTEESNDLTREKLYAYQNPLTKIPYNMKLAVYFENREDAILKYLIVNANPFYGTV